MEYPQKEGRHGPIFQIAEGVMVTRNEWGTWQVLLRQGTERKKKSFGKSTEDQQRAFKAAEMFAVRMGLTLEKQVDDEIKTFEMLIREFFKMIDGACSSESSRCSAGYPRSSPAPSSTTSSRGAR